LWLAAAGSGKQHGGKQSQFKPARFHFSQTGTLPGKVESVPFQ
jgi:hypothetical protein